MFCLDQPDQTNWHGVQKYDFRIKKKNSLQIGSLKSILNCSKNLCSFDLKSNHSDVSVYLKLNGQKRTQPALDSDALYVRVFYSFTHFSPGKTVCMCQFMLKKTLTPHWNLTASNDIEQQKWGWWRWHEWFWCKSLSSVSWSMNFDSM